MRQITRGDILSKPVNYVDLRKAIQDLTEGHAGAHLA